MDLFLFQKGSDLVKALFVLGYVETLLDNRNKHIKYNKIGQNEPQDQERR